MPELPEVETARRGLAPHLQGRRIVDVVLRRPTLRWPIPREVSDCLPGQTIVAVRRRAKYLLIDTAPGCALLHLGMSGMLRILPGPTVAGAHDHVDMALDSGRVLRFTDPRRFGCLLWQPIGEVHPLLRDLGPEPLSHDFDGDFLFETSRNRKVPIKSFLMDQRIVVGVGNIYVAESLFRAGIAPARAAGSIGRERYARLARAIKDILAHAIERGGTTLRDFLNVDGAPGYFEQELSVYGREGEPCKTCGRKLRGTRLANRATAWCARCQT